MATKKLHTPEYWLASQTGAALPVVLGDLTVMDLRRMDPNQFTFAKRVHTTPLCWTQGNAAIAQSEAEVTCKKCLGYMEAPTSRLILFSAGLVGHNVMVQHMRKKEMAGG